MFAGALLAIKEINARRRRARPARSTWVDGDDGTDPARAKATVERLIAEGVQRDHRRRRLVDHARPCCRPRWRPAWSSSRPATRRPSPDRRRRQGPLLPHRAAGRPAGRGADRRDHAGRRRRSWRSWPATTRTARASWTRCGTTWSAAGLTDADVRTMPYSPRRARLLRARSRDEGVRPGRRPGHRLRRVRQAPIEALFKSGVSRPVTV